MGPLDHEKIPEVKIRVSSRCTYLQGISLEDIGLDLEHFAWR